MPLIDRARENTFVVAPAAAAAVAAADGGGSGGGDAVAGDAGPGVAVNADAFDKAQGRRRRRRGVDWSQSFDSFHELLN
ncbi:hypothetical protein M0802_002097 [Mischocyttarus mexicanus]|nr:hypothetical protein M0802_002097 [Mischocyttarus mexicanus]